MLINGLLSCKLYLVGIREILNTRLKESRKRDAERNKKNWSVYGLVWICMSVCMAGHIRCNVQKMFLSFQASTAWERARAHERARRTGPFSSYSDTTWFLLCKQKKISKFDSLLEAVPSPSGRICVTVQGTALGWGAARGKNFSRSR